MQLTRTIAAIAAVCACAMAPASAQTAEPFDPRAYQTQIVGQPTQVLVLGSPHLSGAPDNFDPAVLEPLLQRLEAFRPDIIAVEGMSGESIHALWEYREIYPEVATNYGGYLMMLSTMTRYDLQLDMPEAEAELRRTLASWPAEPTPAQRRRLTALFIASGDLNSALVQWWKLPPAERIEGDEIIQRLITEFATYDRQRRNENHMIGARLAVRLGLERVYPIDDHGSDDVIQQHTSDLDAFMSEPWMEQVMNDPGFTPLREAPQNLRNPRQTLQTYQMLNAPLTGHTDANGQWLSMINRPSPNNVGRTRVAEWETRNLRMVANIREVISHQPGARVLVITGSAHKAWLDAYLRMMTDVEVVDASAALR